MKRKALAKQAAEKARKEKELRSRREREEKARREYRKRQESLRPRLVKNSSKTKRMLKKAGKRSKYDCGKNLLLTPQDHANMARTALSLAPYRPSTCQQCNAQTDTID